MLKKQRKLHIIWWVATVILSFFSGYLTHKFHKGPKKQALGMDVVYLERLNKKYAVYVSYHDEGRIKDFYTKDMHTGECVLEYTTYPLGYTKSYLNKTEKGNIFMVLNESGLPVLRKYLDNDGNVLRQELLEDDGSVREVQDFTNEEIEAEGKRENQDLSFPFEDY